MSATVREPRPHTAADVAARRVAASNTASDRFFRDNAEAIAHACEAMATRFQSGGRLLVHGDSSRQSDVAHVVVEFLHPVVVGKRALPAVAVRDGDALRTIARASDILMLFEDADDAATIVADAKRRGLLTLRLASDASRDADADFRFRVPATDPCIVQETHEMLYHVLWELVHVFLDHRGGAR